VLGEPQLAAPGARAAPPPALAAPPPPLGARCDMPEARRRLRPCARPDPQLTPVCAAAQDRAAGCRMPGVPRSAVPRLSVAGHRSVHSASAAWLPRLRLPPAKRARAVRAGGPSRVCRRAPAAPARLRNAGAAAYTLPRPACRQARRHKPMCVCSPAPCHLSPPGSVQGRLLCDLHGSLQRTGCWAWPHARACGNRSCGRGLLHACPCASGAPEPGHRARATRRRWARCWPTGPAWR